MLESKDFDFLERLLITPSPTGYEFAGQKVWIEEVEKYADSVETDDYGSAVARINIDPQAKTLMFEAHCDEIAMVVQHVDEQGFIWIQRIGGTDPTIARARKVWIHSRDGIVAGVIGHTAIHLQEKDQNKPFAWKDLFIDIGVDNREEALNLVQIGDPITYAYDFDYLNEELLVGRALDNRIGGYVIAKVMERLHAHRAKLRVNILALNSVQEEIGGYGARMMAYRLMPDLAIITDVTHATDTPGINQREHGRVILGEGPTLTHGTASHPKLVRRVQEIAESNKIPIQHEASSVRTGTDTDSIFFTKHGIPSALISLPLRYMHTPVETVSLSDVNKIIDLMVYLALSMGPSEEFKVHS